MCVFVVVARKMQMMKNVDMYDGWELTDFLLNSVFLWQKRKKYTTRELQESRFNLKMEEEEEKKS